MADAPRRGVRDDEIGFGPLVTPTPALGGRLKVRIEDFVVEEVAAPPTPDPAGPFVAARVRLVNWETNAFVREASTRLGVSRKKIHFSGTKDKRGVTERWFTFEAPEASVRGLGQLGGVVVEETVRTRHELELGQHAGNRFRVVVRRVAGTPEEALRAGRATMDAVQAMGGAPNYFGPQRFGVRRATTHRVGERILRGDFEGAVLVYLTAPGPTDDPETRAWRETVARTRDWRAALASLHADLAFDRALLHRMVETGDGLAALQALPTTLQRLFVGAVQSWLFNRTLARRIERGLPLDLPVPGDLVAPVEAGRALDEWVPVTQANLGRVIEEARRGRAAVTAPLPGTEVPMADGEPGQLEREVLAEANLVRRDFLVPEHLEWSSKGTRRPVLVQPDAMEVEAAADELHPDHAKLTFAFGLPPGCYATSVLREFLKSPWLEDYA